MLGKGVKRGWVGYSSVTTILATWLKVKGFLWARVYSRIGPETNTEVQELSWVSGV